MGVRVSNPEGPALGPRGSKNSVRVRAGESVAVLLAVGAILAMTGGCADRKSASSSLFVAPITTTPAITVLADKLDFLREIEPNKLDSVLIDQPSEPYGIGHLYRHEADGRVVRSDEMLAYESKSRAILSVNTCPEGTGLLECGRVRLNYSSKGFEDEQTDQGGVAQNSSISTAVTPIVLKSGWLLAYDGGSKNIVAFRQEGPRVVAGGDSVEFRPSTRELSNVNSNFGYGNGLVMSLVISGEDLARQIRATSQPIVTRFVELDDTHILLFFSTVRSVHLLELSEVDTPLVWDLNDPADPETLLPVPLLRGTIKLFDNPLGGPQLPFLTFREISETITGNDNVLLSSFQPILIPDNGDVLVFEQVTSYLLRIGARRNNAADPAEITGGTVGRAAFPQNLLAALQEGVGGNIVNPPLELGGAFYHQTLPAICIYEEKTNNLVTFFYEKTINNNIDLFIQSSEFLQPRTQGSSGGGIATEPVLSFAQADVTNNRLAFDQGADRLLSINYPAGGVVVVADRTTLIAVTGNSLADLTYTEPVDSDNLRALDTQSTSLLALPLTYISWPVKVQ